MPNTRDQAFDQALGARIRFARMDARMSQGALGEQLGVSFQQIQKYELGKDRISVQRLSGIAAALGRTAASFLEDEPGVVPLQTKAVRQHLKTAEMLNGLQPEVRLRVVKLIEALAQADAAPSTTEQPDLDPAVAEHREAA